VLFTLNNTEQMRLTSTGLGIGTSSPSQKLDVSGSARVTGSVYSTSFINTTNGTSYFTDASTGNGIYVGGSTATPANAVRVFTNAAEVARFDSSGNLGLGVAPSAWGSLYKALQNAAGFYGNYSTTNIIVGQNWYDAAAGSYRYVNNGHATYYTQVSGTHSWHTAPSGTAGNAISFTQAMTLDASGRLFVNATSTTETAQLLVSGTKTISSGIPLNQIGVTDATAMAAGVGGAINFIGKYTSGGLETSFASIEASKDNGTSGDFGAAMLFKTRVNGGAQTERARIDSSGNLLVGSASGTGARIYARGGADVLFADATGSNTGYVYRTATNSAQAGYFITSAGQAGYIQCTGNTTSYVSGSDYRLKDNIRPIDGALAKVAAMRPVAFEWKSDGSYGESFLAHELAEVCPQAVTGEKDAVDEEGKPVYQGIDTSFLVATLTAALQEAHGLIKDQSAAITALTARVAALESN
jgi:hypothetical protein